MATGNIHSDVPASEVRLPPGEIPSGIHLVADLFQCIARRIQFVEDVRRVLEEAARLGHATVLHRHYHQFEPFGVTGFLLIAESHISLHTWPEHHFATLDVQTCGDTMAPDAVVRYVVDQFGAGTVQLDTLQRGRLAASNHAPTRHERYFS